MPFSIYIKCYRREDPIFREKDLFLQQFKISSSNLRDLWDNVKCPNIRIIGVPEEEDKKKGHEKLLEEIIAENFPRMGKEIATQDQETQRVPNRINPGKTLQDTY